MRITASLPGALRADLAAEGARIARAVPAAIRPAGHSLKDDLRRQVRRAGLGPRLARTWQARFYPNRGHDAASLVWSKAPHIIAGHDRGTLITGRSGLWLAIPTPAAPQRVHGKPVTPARLERAWGVRLRFVHRRTGPSLLVADQVRARGGQRGGFAAASATARRTGRGLTSVPMFILVRRVHLPARLDVARLWRRAGRALPERLDARLRRTAAR